MGLGLSRRGVREGACLFLRLGRWEEGRRGRWAEVGGPKGGGRGRGSLYLILACARFMFSTKHGGRERKGRSTSISRLILVYVRGADDDERTKSETSLMNSAGRSAWTQWPASSCSRRCEGAREGGEVGSSARSRRTRR